MLTINRRLPPECMRSVHGKKRRFKDKRKRRAKRGDIAAAEMDLQGGLIITGHTAHRTFFEAPVTNAPACGSAASQADLPIPPHVSPFPPPRCTPSPLSVSGHHHRTHIRLTPH